MSKPAVRVSSDAASSSAFPAGTVEHTFESPAFGEFSVFVTGDPLSQPVLLTYHDVGLTAESCFASFMNYLTQSSGKGGDEVNETTRFFTQFAVIHFNAPGQAVGGSELEAGTLSMDKLADDVDVVRAHFALREFVGVGVGAGAYVLADYALRHPDVVSGLVLFGVSVRKVGWIEWGTLKFGRLLNAWTTVDTYWNDWFLDRYVCEATRTENTDLLEQLRDGLHKIPAKNLQQFVLGYAGRRDLTRLAPEDLPSVPRGQNAVLFLVGDCTPLEAETVVAMEFMNKLGWVTDWVHAKDCGMLVHEENPQAVVDPLKYFLMGRGFR